MKQRERNTNIPNGVVSRACDAPCSWLDDIGTTGGGQNEATERPINGDTNRVVGPVISTVVVVVVVLVTAAALGIIPGAGASGVTRRRLPAWVGVATAAAAASSEPKTARRGAMNGDDNGTVAKGAPVVNAEVAGVEVNGVIVVLVVAIVVGGVRRNGDAIVVTRAGVGVAANGVRAKGEVTGGGPPLGIPWAAIMTARGVAGANGKGGGGTNDDGPDVGRHVKPGVVAVTGPVAPTRADAAAAVVVVEVVVAMAAKGRGGSPRRVTTMPAGSGGNSGRASRATKNEPGAAS